MSLITPQKRKASFHEESPPNAPTKRPRLSNPDTRAYCNVIKALHGLIGLRQEVEHACSTLDGTPVATSPPRLAPDALDADNLAQHLPKKVIIPGGTRADQRLADAHNFRLHDVYSVFQTLEDIVASVDDLRVDIRKICHALKTIKALFGPSGQRDEAAVGDETIVEDGTGSDGGSESSITSEYSIDVQETFHNLGPHALSFNVSARPAARSLLSTKPRSDDAFDDQALDKSKIQPLDLDLYVTGRRRVSWA
ncbi:hypothetical protein PQX77_008157 [Marasmius sp. AFHP31]|nr:hypothetical protein PQX77_008157 [Marasmius sp. AFHP31]